jgi:oligo-1,6-glucosidase
LQKDKWQRESIVYQIYPKSFCDSNADGIGDLRGLISKLDYIKELGVDVVWLSPIYASPQFDNGYDISDYETIDPIYGTIDDFDALIEQAHSRGLKIIMDLVVNHTSDRHPWFASRHDFYIWRNGKGDAPPNNWGALFGGSAWTYDETVGKYYLGLFSKHQPDLNWENSEMRHEIYAMMRRWLERGVDGFRMDVISLISKPETMPDGEITTNGYGDWSAFVPNGPRVHEFLREMRCEVLKDFDTFTVAEAAGVTLDEAKKYTSPEELDMVFHFEHMDLDGGETFKWTDREIPLDGLKQVMTKWQLGLGVANALFFNNHDQPRMVSRLGDEGIYRERSAKMLAVCLHFMQGTPFVYQGEELGMINAKFTSIDEVNDPESIDAYYSHTRSGMFTEEEMLRYISMKGRDNARTPIPWNDANRQFADADSVFHFYKNLIQLRRTHKSIIYGSYTLVDTGDLPLFAYVRQGEAETLFICCNFSRESVTYTLPTDFRDILICNNTDSTFLKTGILAPFEAIVLHRATDSV